VEQSNLGSAVFLQPEILFTESERPEFINTKCAIDISGEIFNFAGCANDRFNTDPVINGIAGLR
jgi:hypothetical protein